MEGERFFSANGSPAYFAETLPTVSCVTVGSSLKAWLPCEIAFFQSLGNRDKTTVIKKGTTNEIIFKDLV